MFLVELWTKATDDITSAVAKHLDPDGPIRVMAISGATKGGFTPIRQLAGMRGLMADPAGRIISKTSTTPEVSRVYSKLCSKAV